MFILKFDTGMGLREEAFTLSQLREAKGLCKGNDPLYGFELGPGEPTEDERFLFDTFTKLVMGDPPLCMSSDHALVTACDKLEKRIAERVEEAKRRASAPPPESGWLIEKFRADGNSTNLALGVPQSGCVAWGTFDSALRFARKVDAERAATILLEGQEQTIYHVTEHAWG